MPNDFGVEGVPREADASVTQKIVGDPASSPDGWANSKQRKVAGPTAEVSNQNQLIVIERGFVIARSGDRLQLKFQGFEARLAERLSEAVLGVLIVGVGFGADELHRPAHHCGIDANTELIFRFLLQIA